MDGSVKTSHKALLDEHREQSLQNLVNVYQTKLKEEHSQRLFKLGHPNMSPTSNKPMKARPEFKI